MTLRLSDDFDSDLDVCTVFVCWSLGTDYITYTAFLLLPSSQKATLYLASSLLTIPSGSEHNSDEEESDEELDDPESCYSSSLIKLPLTY